MALPVCRKYNSVLYSYEYIGWEIDKLSSTLSHHTPSFAPNDYPYTNWGGLWVSQRVWGGVGRGAGVEFRIILAANAQCHIRIPFILFSTLSSLIL